MRNYWMEYLDGNVWRIWGCEAENASEAADKCKAKHGVSPKWSSISIKHPRGMK